MLHPGKSLVFVASLALGIGALGTAQAGETLKGAVEGSAHFADGKSPANGFQTTDATGKVSHLGRTSALLEMVPRLSGPKGAPAGFIGSATLTSANGDALDMFIVTGAPEFSKSDDGTIDVATFTGHYRMDGGTGRFTDASAASRIVITIRCDFYNKTWTITISW